MNTIEIVIRCRYCGENGPALVEPTRKKRVVNLFCARCGNHIRIQYIPKKGENKHDEHH